LEIFNWAIANSLLLNYFLKSVHWIIQSLLFQNLRFFKRIISFLGICIALLVGVFLSWYSLKKIGRKDILLLYWLVWRIVKGRPTPIILITGAVVFLKMFGKIHGIGPDIITLRIYGYAIGFVPAFLLCLSKDHSGIITVALVTRLHNSPI